MPQITTAAFMWRSAARTFLTVLECVVVAAVIAAALEGVSRVVHLGQRPMLPYVIDDGLAPRMPGLFDSDVRFGKGQVFRVCTDSWGLRGSCGALQPDAVPAVLAVGDSQALGWGMNYQDSFAPLIALALVGPHASSAARSMAAGGADVENLRPWASDYTLAHDRIHPRLNVVLVNLGNDLDEMYFGRSVGSVPAFKSLRGWLAVHSFLMMDITLLRNALFDGGNWQLPPGANPIVATLNHAERLRLASAAAESTEALIRALPQASQTLVLLVPTDYQIATSEFDKYEPFYASHYQFMGWAKNVDEAARRLDEIQYEIGKRLTFDGFTVVSPNERLKRHDPREIIDRQSHHFSVAGQRVLADALLAALPVAP